MYTEIVKVDAKGRITIPAYVRLLLNVDEGSRIVLNVDEDRGVLMLKVFRENWVKCEGVVNKSELVKILNNLKVISVKCFNLENEVNEYRCDMVLELEKIKNKHLDGIPEGLNCYNSQLT